MSCAARFQLSRAGLRSFRTALAAAAALVPGLASAQSTLYWTGSSTWGDAAAWSTDAAGTIPGSVPTSADTAFFSADTVTLGPTVGLLADRSLAGLAFGGTATGTTTLAGGGVNALLTLGPGGIAVSSTVGSAVTIGSAAANQGVAVAVGADQTWTNDSTSRLLSILGGVSRAAGDTTSRTLTVGGNGSSTISGAITDGGASGSLGLTKTGGGRLTLAGANSYSGTTTISGGTLAIGSGGSLSGSPITVGAGGTFDVSAAGFTLGSGQSIGGDGTVVGNLVFGAGAKFAFTPNDFLQLAVTSGSASFASAFGVADLLGLDSTAAEGTYTLISGSVDFTNLDNVGAGDAYDIGGGKSAYFQQGSLQLIIVPEPGAMSLAVLGVAAAVVAVRRRRAAG